MCATMRSYPSSTYGIAFAELRVTMRTSLLLSVLALAIAAPMTLLACSGEEKKAQTNDSDIQANEPASADEGDVCWETKDCADGLVCKRRPSGPPPGAVGLPIPADQQSAGHSFPPGAMGMPMPPNTCQRPAPGEEGSECLSDDSCNDGLICKFEEKSSSSGGMPPGAMGMPVPADQGSSMPPGAVGMPILKRGTCEPRPSGPPPGAVGMPIHP